MTACARIGSSCDGTDVRPTYLYLRRQPRPMCAGCRAALDRLGASYTVAEPVETGPRWLANLRGRDETGALVA